MGERIGLSLGVRRLLSTFPAVERFEQRFGERYPAIGRIWRDAWDRFVPMLDYPPAIRRVLYTTNTVESLIIGSPDLGVVDVADEVA